MEESLLKGIRVADFAWAWAGAHIGTLLSFLGAEVIKIESRKRPDFTRTKSITTGQTFEGLDQSLVFNDINLGKLSVSLNLEKPKGVELAKEIVRISDISTQNWRPGAMDAFGLGYADFRKVKQDIIYLSSSALGSTGPWGKDLGLAPTFAAMSGISYITGYEDGPPAELSGEIDILSAYAGTFAVLAALNHRQRTGNGLHIDLSSTEVMSMLIGDVIMDYTMNERVQSRKGNRDDSLAPHNLYRCEGEDKWISIAIATEEEWTALCEVMGNPEWARNEKFANLHSRWQNHRELDRLIEAWTSNYTPYALMEKLQSKGIAAVPSFNSEELYKDPHLKEQGFWVEVTHPITGKQTVAAPPWQFSKTPAKVRGCGPLFGEHNRYVLGELLGLSDTEIEDLEKEEVIY